VEGPDEIHAAQAITARFVRKHGEDRSKPGMLRMLSESTVRMMRKLKTVSPLVALSLFVGELRTAPSLD